MRPWFGEYALWFAKPHNVTAVALEPSTLLAMDSSHFSTFLELVPNFLASSSFGAGRRRSLSLRSGPADEPPLQPELPPGPQADPSRLQAAAAIAIRWSSSGKLGAFGKPATAGSRLDTSERSLFAGRWERLVLAVLYAHKKTAAGGVLLHSGGQRITPASTVSFHTGDFNVQPLVTP